MKKISILSILLSFFIFSPLLSQEKSIVIDHNCVKLEEIPEYWIEKANSGLFIGYGHTSHGSQITSGMSAIKSYFTDKKFDWNNTGSGGALHLFEGSGYNTGYLDHDCGYAGWDDKTRLFLNAYPDCNVIMWSWCGQVNDVNLETHYLQPMAKLEEDYPNVRFVYMTGHLEGLGPNGSLFKANQTIRDFCNEHGKILFDFADIEKYSPDCDINYQEYFASDDCSYNKNGSGKGNWANEWLENNPNHILTKISAKCGSCAHSVSLNCVKKGVAAWYLWSRLAGWDGIVSSLIDDKKNRCKNNNSFCFPNPSNGFTNIYLRSPETGKLKVLIFDTYGNKLYTIEKQKSSDEIIIAIDLFSYSIGLYIYRIEIDENVITYGRLSLIK